MTIPRRLYPPQPTTGWLPITILLVVKACAGEPMPSSIRYPVLPAVSDIENCGGGIFTIPSQPGANGTTNRWYNASSGGTLLATDTSYTTGFIATNTTFWVSSYNSATGCEGSRVPVHIVIHPIPHSLLPMMNRGAGLALLHLPQQWEPVAQHCTGTMHR